MGSQEGGEMLFGADTREEGSQGGGAERGREKEGSGSHANLREARVLGHWRWKGGEIGREAEGKR